MKNIGKAKKWIESKEKDVAKSIIKYKLLKEGQAGVDENTLNSGAERVVTEANRIVKERGKEIVSHISRGIEGFMKRAKK